MAWNVVCLTEIKQKREPATAVFVWEFPLCLVGDPAEGITGVRRFALP